MINNFSFNLNKNYLIFFLIILSIFSLITGPFVPDLIVTISSIFFIFFFFKNKNFFFFESKKLLYGFIIFYFYLLFNTTISQISFESLKTTIPYLRFTLFVLFLSIFFQNKKYQYYLLISLLTLYFFLLIDTLYQISTGFNILGYEIIQGRPSSFFKDRLILGSFCSRTLPLVIFLIFNTNITNKKIFFFLSLIVTGLLIFFSKERTSFFLYILTFLFSVYYYHSIKHFLLYLFYFILCILSLSFFFKDTSSRIFKHTANQIYHNKNLYIFSERHELHYLTAYNIFIKYPIFGSGVKSFRFLCDQKEFDVTNYIEKSKIVKSETEGYLVFLKNKEEFPLTSYLVILDKEFIKELIKNNNLEFYLKNNIYLDISRSQLHIKKIYLINDKHHFNLIHPPNTFLSSGVDIFSNYEFKNGCNTHPHNFYIQLASETGIVGLIFLLLFYIYNIIYFVKLIKKKIFYKIIDNKFILYANYIIILFPFIPNGNFFNNYLSILLYLPLIFLNICLLKK